MKTYSISIPIKSNKNGIVLQLPKNLAEYLNLDYGVKEIIVMPINGTLVLTASQDILNLIPPLDVENVEKSFKEIV